MSHQRGDSRLYGLVLDTNRQPPELYNLIQFYSAQDGPWLPSGIIHPGRGPNSQSRPSIPTTTTTYGHADADADANPNINPNINPSANSTTPYDFQDYRSVGPSECDTALGDSGYGGSHPTYSIAADSAPSINGEDRRAEARAAEQFIGDLNIASGRTPYKSADTQAPFDEPPKPKFYCHVCKVPVKTKSELKKHDQRHSKPHKCNYEHCSKAVTGFSTPNDLTRHKRTVHREHKAYGLVYVCRNENCTSKKPKLWPRADNFRSHLARTHGIRLKADDDLTYYRHQSSPSGPHDLRGVGSSVAGLDPNARPLQLQDSPGLQGEQTSTDVSSRVPPPPPPPEFSNRPTLPPTLRNTSREDESQFISPSVIANLEMHEVSSLQPLTESNPPPPPSPPPPLSLIADSLHEETTPSPEAHETTLDQDDIVIGVADDVDDHCATETETEAEAFDNRQLMTRQIEQHDEPCPSQIAILRDSLGSEFQQASHESKESSGSSMDSLSFLIASVSHDKTKLLELIKAFPPNLLEMALKASKGGPQESEKHNSTQDETNQKETSKCDLCSKSFSQKCKLRKHMKRHIRPYGCTYPNCAKMFGSKNDWKRHESSQHFQLETWNCDVHGCKKAFPHREIFKRHLMNDHRCEDERSVEGKLESCRLGRHCDPRFWCGFCLQIIEIKEKGVNSWTKRCDHIDNHLFGKDGLDKKSMDEWCHLEHALEGGGQSEDKNSQELRDDGTNFSSASPQNETKKRKADEDSNPRPRKTLGYIWRCCQCGHMEGYKTSTSCMELECGHVRCTNCITEQVPDSDSV